jgi:hypothetical protein
MRPYTPQSARYRADDDIRINVSATAWMDRARCVGKDPSVENAEEARQFARRHCTLCPVRVECLQYGISIKASAIVYGGTFFNSDGVPNLRWPDQLAEGAA